MLSIDKYSNWHRQLHRQFLGKWIFNIVIGSGIPREVKHTSSSTANTCRNWMMLE